MNMRQNLIAGAVTMLLALDTTMATGGDRNSHSQGDGERLRMVRTEHPHPVGQQFAEQPHGNSHSQGDGSFKAPEIDAASGTTAIALLTGVLLLMSEKSRSRRS